MSDTPADNAPANASANASDAPDTSTNDGADIPQHAPDDPFTAVPKPGTNDAGNIDGIPNRTPPDTDATTAAPSQTIPTPSTGQTEPPTNRSTPAEDRDSATAPPPAPQTGTGPAQDASANDSQSVNESTQDTQVTT